MNATKAPIKKIVLRRSRLTSLGKIRIHKIIGDIDRENPNTENNNPTKLYFKNPKTNTYSATTNNMKTKIIRIGWVFLN